MFLTFHVRSTHLPISMTFSSEQGTMITTLIATGTFSGFFGSDHSTAKLIRRHLDFYILFSIYTSHTQRKAEKMQDLLNVGVHFLASS